MNSVKYPIGLGIIFAAGAVLAAVNKCTADQIAGFAIPAGIYAYFTVAMLLDKRKRPVAG